MPKPVMITPNGPQAIKAILLEQYYSSEGERHSLVNELLGGIEPERERIDCIRDLLKKAPGRKCFGLKLDRAFEKLATWGQPSDCLEVFCALPQHMVVGRKILLRSICKLGRRLVDDAQYRSKFQGLLLMSEERRLLLAALGQKVLVDRLLRPAKERPALRLLAG